MYQISLTTISYSRKPSEDHEEETKTWNEKKGESHLEVKAYGFKTIYYVVRKIKAFGFNTFLWLW